MVAMERWRDVEPTDATEAAAAAAAVLVGLVAR